MRQSEKAQPMARIPESEIERLKDEVSVERLVALLWVRRGGRPD